MKNTLFLCLVCLLSYQAAAQSKWSVQNAVGFANETNLADLGLRLSSKVNRHIGRKWAGFISVGSFQMLASKEDLGPDAAYQKMRSLSTFNIDLGPAFYLLNNDKFQISVNAGGAYRGGRQLWPERAVVANGHQDIYYTHEKLSEFGYVIGCDLGVSLNKTLGIFLDGHWHSYNYFGEYAGFGLGCKISL